MVDNNQNQIVFDSCCVIVHLLHLCAIDESLMEGGSVELHKRASIDLESTQNEYNIITRKNMHISLSLIRSGLSCIRQSKLSEANSNFTEACKHATNAFNEANSFSELSLSMRLQVLCSIMIENGCFIPSEGDFCDKSKLIENCQQFFKKFTTHPFVAPALREEFEGRSVFEVMAGRMKLSESSRASRQHILHEINSFNIFFEHQFDIRFPVFRSLSESVNLSDAKEFVLTRTTTQITCMVTHQGRLFAGCGDNSITVYDLVTFNKVNTLRGHSFFVEVLVVHEEVLYSASYDRVVLVWDLSTLRPTAIIRQCSKMITSLAVCSSISGGSKLLFTGSLGDESYLRVWSLTSLTEVKQKPYEGTFFTVYALTSRENRLYVSSTWYRGVDEALHFHCITVWDLTHDASSMVLVGILKGHFHNIRSLCFYGRHTLCSGSCDQTVILWDSQSLELQQMLKGHSGDVGALTHYNQRLYASDGGRGVRSWHLLSPSSGSDVRGAAFHEPIKQLVAEKGRLLILSGGSVYVRLL